MAVIDEVKQRLDIVGTVSEYVSLTPAGRNFRAHCPFHTERTPSFYVFPERQTWRCFGACATGGDAFTFVMKADNLTFPEALRLLARRAGVALPSPRSQERLSPLHRINEAATSFYHEYLLLSSEGAEAIRYLEGRGISRDSIVAFTLGLAPQDWEGLKSHLAAAGYTEELMEQAGLVHRSPDGRTRDLFRGRLLFPIRDAAGHVVGLGGRTLDESTPKYLNTPKTPVFDKSRLLYGLHAATEAIRRENLGVIVEGYTDTVMAHQHGFHNVVASMGTALTEQQVGQLVGLASGFVLALDPDTAGQEATLRSLEASWKVFQPPLAQRRPGGAGPAYQEKPAVELRVALLPQGLDPAELIRQDPDGWTRAIEGAQELMDFLFELLPPRYDLTTSEGKLQLAERVGGLLLAEENPGLQDRYLEKLEVLLGVPRRTLDETLGLSRRALLQTSGRRTRRTASVQGYVAPFTQAAHDPLEEYTLALLLQDPSLQDQCGDLSAELFQRAENRELFTEWQTCSTMGRLKEVVDVSLREHLDTLATRVLPPLDGTQREEALAQCLRRLEERSLRELKAQEGVLFGSSEAALEDEEDALEGILERNRRLRELFVAGSHRGPGRET